MCVKVRHDVDATQLRGTPTTTPLAPPNTHVADLAGGLFHLAKISEGCHRCGARFSGSGGSFCSVQVWVLLQPAPNIFRKKLVSQASRASRERLASAMAPWTEVTFLADKTGKQVKRIATNRIRTSKYTLLSFFPMSFFGQFRRFANLYFLLQCGLMVVGQYTNLFQTSLNAWSTTGTLLVVMGVTLAMEAKDDYYRHTKDLEVNLKTVPVLRTGAPNSPEGMTGEATVVTWEDIKVRYGGRENIVGARVRVGGGGGGRPASNFAARCTGVCA